MIRAMSAGIIAFVVAALGAITGAETFVGGSGAQLPSEMAGPWAGKAEIVVNWINARYLPVRVVIRADGSVTGTVGDATLRDGRLEPNRTAIGRALHIKTDWVIRGALDGDLIKVEGITRDGVTMPLNFEGGRFEGGVNTTGSHFGGKESMWLAAKGLVLQPVR